MLTSRWPWLPVGPPCRRREIRGRQVVPVNNWLPCQLLTASFVPLRQAQGTKRRTHYRGLPSMAAGGKCRHSIFLCYAEDRPPCDKNGKPHMEWSCKNSRGRQEVPVSNWLPCQLLTASFVPLRQAQGTKRRTHYRGLPSMAAGVECGEGKWDVIRSVASSGHKNGGDPCGECTVFAFVLVLQSKTR